MSNLKVVRNKNFIIIRPIIIKIVLKQLLEFLMKSLFLHTILEVSQQIVILLVPTMCRLFY